MFRFLLAAAMVAAALYGVREHRVLEEAGLFSSCEALATTVVTDSQWLGCTSGRLTGYPDLSRDNCVRASSRGAIQLWRCPAPLVASRVLAGAPSP
jgi:hypothetical protein